jgi:AAA+ ATPase superfamily predicted ATPase
MIALSGQQWGFYGRAAEQAEIDKIVSSGRWFFCSISGRRRIGKTTLIQRALEKRSAIGAIYFQVPDSDERGVVQTFQDALEDSGTERETVEKIRTFAHMADTIEFLCRRGFIVVIDEFQYFHRKSLAPFASHLQAKIDRLRDTRKGGLFVLGSIHTAMTAILEDRLSPLFNRVTHRIALEHWDFSTIFEMFDSHGVVDPAHRLFLWSLFEGVPKFYRDCFEAGVLTEQADYRKQTLSRLFFEGASPLRDEATNWFLRELRGRYDSVLKLLAKKAPCSYRDLVAEYSRSGAGDEKQLSAYLTTLIERYQMVDKLQPIFSGVKSRKARYVIADNFLASWLRALGRNTQIARIRPVGQAISRADDALKVQEGYGFEKMIRLLTEECSRKSAGDFALTEVVRGYWNKADGSDIEIDLVAINEDEAIVRFGSCKRSSQSHSEQDLFIFGVHVDNFLQTKEGRRLSSFKIERALYSPLFQTPQRQDMEERGYICRDLIDFAQFLGQKTPSMAEADGRGPLP